MSKADNMLEELGFLKFKDTLIENVINWEINYLDKDIYGRQRRITFFEDSYFVTLRDTFSDKDITGARVNKEEHLAIHEKIKELGWLND